MNSMVALSYAVTVVKSVSYFCNELRFCIFCQAHENSINTATYAYRQKLPCAPLAQMQHSWKWYAHAEQHPNS